MGLTACGECGGLLYETADTCLHCGATTKSRTSAITWLGVLAWAATTSIGLLVLSAYVSGLTSPRPPPSVAPSPGAPAIASSVSVPRLPLIVLPPRETLKGKIKEVQRLLADLGYPIGQADGIVCPKTRAAVKAFQRKEGLAGDGEVSEQLLAQLRRAGERR
jgi:hypothetical protein